ncbi:hypothetical protein ONA23_04625 [Mycoplasmopsis cynos]|uniref:hypothetical protein n=1 Tax=Mycoplasmopsis cynos TaxID=171284 RepID=UPI0024C86065|nr:hypothetical protein [Mycoplasmopsis cynos]WAM06276.1 hypothetical protein ONA23_04625 [Mycoplasmopsis cynos]
MHLVYQDDKYTNYDKFISELAVYEQQPENLTSEKYNEIIKKKEIVEKELVFNTDLDKVKSKARSIINILDDKKEYDKEIKNANIIEKLSAIIDQMIQQYKDQEAKKIKDKK